MTIQDVATLNDSSAACEYRHITVKDKDGKTVETAEAFPLKLKALGAGETYTIEYDIAVTDYGVNANGITISNSVTATTGTGENKIEKTKEIKTTIASEKITKSGWYDKANGEILWTIVIRNPGKEDLSQSGVLTDTPKAGAGEYKEGSLEVKDAQKKKIENGSVNKTETGFTYQFPDGSTSETYTLTYRTKVKEGTEGTVWNHVSFDGTEKDGSTDTGKLEDWGIWKGHDAPEEVDEHTKKLNWKVSLQLSEKEKTTKIVYTDQVIDSVDADGTSYAQSHYTTVEELENSIRNTLYLSLKNGWVSVGQSEDYTVTVEYFADEQMTTPVAADDKTAKVKSFRLTVEKKDGTEIDGTKLDVSYHTFVDMSQLKDLKQWSIKNNGYFQDKTASSEYTYKQDSPAKDTAFVKERVNVYDWNSANVGRANGDVELKNTKGELYYRIALKAPTGQFPCTITDTLGNGMRIKTDENGKPDWIIAFYDPTTGGYSTAGNPAQYVQYEKVSSDDANEVWKFTLSDYHASEAYSHDGIEILYKVDITDHDVWKNATTEETNEENSVKYAHVFTNKATWNDQEQKTDTNVYQIVQDFQKEGNYVTTGKDAYMPKYSVVINANGKDLDATSDTIELQDTLYVGDNTTYAYLELNDVKLYYYDRVTGTKGEEIDPSRYSVQYDQTTHTITAVLPDELPCVLEYGYKLDSSFQGQISLSNSVLFKGKTVVSKYMSVQESSGYIRAANFQVQKIDSEQNAKVLSGAEFALYYFDTAAQKFVRITDDAVDGVYTTGEDGILQLTRALYPDNEGRTDVLLMLVETKAPEGYKRNSEPSYFVLEKDKKVHDVYAALPEKYRSEIWNQADIGQSFSAIGENTITAFSQYGGLLYVRNTSNQIVVKKVWVDDTGKELSNPPENITFKLQKTTSDTANIALKIRRWRNDNTQIGGEKYTYKVKKGSQITLTFDTGEWQDTNNVSVTLDGKQVSIEKTEKQNRSYAYRVSFYVDSKENHTLLLNANNCGGSGLPENMGAYHFTTAPVQGEQTTEEEVTLRAADQWTYTAAAEEGATYTVSEVKVNGKPVEDTGYTVSYYNNAGIDHGEIVITNKQKEKMYELPSTGGTGTILYYAGGAALMCLAVLLYGYQRRRIRERREA